MELKDLRERLTRLDGELLALIAERQRISEEVARAKRAAGLPTRDFQRERDVLLDAMRQQGWTQVTPSNLRPTRFGNVDGIRFDVQLTHQNGLIYRGTFAAVERGELLTHFFWIAPAEHYYGRDIAAVNSMFDSARFVD